MYPQFGNGIHSQYAYTSRYYFPTPRRPMSPFWRYFWWIGWRTLLLSFCILTALIVLDLRMWTIEEKRENRERLAIESGVMRGLTEPQIAKIFPRVTDHSYPGMQALISNWDAYFYLTAEREYYFAVKFDEAGRANRFRVVEIHHFDPFMD